MPHSSMLAMLLPILVLLVCTAVFAAGQDADGDMDCNPTLADKCFVDVGKNLQCQSRMNRNTPECRNRSLSDLCSGLDDALVCASEIIAADCTKQEGRDRFEAWMRGLRAVYASLCGADPSGLLELTANPNCWSPVGFVSCTERMIQIDHINDLLRTPLSMNECNRLLVAMSICNVKATNMDNLRCSPALDIVGEMIHTFFTATECGRVCTAKSRSVGLYSSPVLLLLTGLLKIRD